MLTEVRVSVVDESDGGEEYSDVVDSFYRSRSFNLRLVYIDALHIFIDHLFTTLFAIDIIHELLKGTKHLRL